MTRKYWWFEESTPHYNSLLIFILTTLFYFAGAALRLIDQLSLFWPLNAVMAGVFIRYPFSARLRNYLLCYLAMLLYDALTTHWGVASLIINLSNMVFIVTASQLMITNRDGSTSIPQPANALRLFVYCLFAALLCAIVGALGSARDDQMSFLLLCADWFSEQFSTSVLILPFLLTVRPFSALPRWDNNDIWPVVAVVAALGVSVIIGGPGSLAFPLPALIWCALRFPLAVTCFITLLTGIAEIVMVAYGLVKVNAHLHLVVNELFSTRLGIATITICPLIVAMSMASINNLLQQISRRADFDHLTNAYSRSGFFEFIKRRQKLTGPEPGPLSVIMLDIDHFKHINDRWGHECGDQVLRECVRQVKITLRDRGLLARMGGEEFTIVCTGYNLPQAVALAEEIRTDIAAMTINWQEQPIRLTVSLGVESVYQPGENTLEEINHLLLLADKHLYRAKQSGRNCTSSLLSEQDLARQRIESP